MNAKLGGLITNKKPALGGLEKDQALRSLLTATRDNSPAMMPSSHSGLVGTGVAAGAGATTTPVSVPPIASCRNSKQLSLALLP